jgi:hypothetical protein
MRLLVLFSATTTFALGLAACTTDSNSSSSSSGGPGADAGASADAAADGGAATDAGPNAKRGTGSIQVDELDDGSGPRAVGFASFRSPLAVAPAPSTECTTVKEGACTLRECDLTVSFDAAAPTEDAGPAIPDVGAGDMVLLAADSPDAGVKGSYVAPMYSFEPIPISRFAGTRFVAKATGAEVPAFEVSRAAPAKVSLSAPACANGTCAELDSSKDIAFTWTGGGDGDVVVSVYNELRKPYVIADCQFPSAQGTGTIPKALASKFPAGTVRIKQWEESRQLVTAGDYDIAFRLVSRGTSGTTTIK